MSLKITGNVKHNIVTTNFIEYVQDNVRANLPGGKGRYEVTIQIKFAHNHFKIKKFVVNV